MNLIVTTASFYSPRRLEMMSRLFLIGGRFIKFLKSYKFVMTITIHLLWECVFVEHAHDNINLDEYINPHILSVINVVFINVH